MRKIAFLLIAFVTLNVHAQEEFTHIAEGNRHFRAGKFTEAEISYRKGLMVNPKSFEAAFNLGNALFRQEKYAEALEQYQRVIPSDNASRKKLAAALHNAGNALIAQQKVKESIDAYKQSLRLNPKDDETRYNLAFAQHMLNNQQQPPQQQNQEDQQSQEQKQEKKQDQSQPREEEISKERAQQILQALMQEERETMEKARKQPNPVRRGTDKDW